MEDIDNILGIFVNTYNSGKYSDWDTLRSKFPELKDYDSKVLGAFVNTYNSGKYSEWDTLMSKFPEFSFKSIKKSSGSILSKSPYELQQEYLDTPVMEQTLSENIEGRKTKVDNIIAKYDKDREFITNSLYNEKAIPLGDKSTIKAESTGVVNYSKPKFVKDLTDFKLVQELDVNDALLLTPKESFRIIKGKHAEEVNEKNKKLVDSKTFEVVKGIQNSYAGFIKGLSDSWYMNFSDEDKELAAKAVDVALKKTQASSEIIKQNIEAKELSTHRELIGTKRAQVDDAIKGALGEDAYNDLFSEQEYIKRVKSGEIERDVNYENSVKEAKEKLAHTGLGNLYDSLSENYYATIDKEQALPEKYKRASIADKAERDLMTYRDNLSRNKSDYANAVFSFSDAFDSAVERNFLKGIPNTVMSALASVGIDFGEAYVLAESTQPGILTTTTTKNLKPTFSKSAEYTDPDTGVTYDILFNDKGNIVDIYGVDGYKANLENEKFQDIAQKVNDLNLFSKAKTDFNTESALYKGVSTALDVAATILIAKGVAGVLPKSAGAGMLQNIAMPIQYWGNSTVDAIRNGDLTPQEASWYGGATTALETIIERINPMMGRVAKGLGRISAMPTILGRRELLGALGKYPTRAAVKRGFTSTILDIASEEFEEGVSLGVMPLLNTAANNILGGSFDTDMPSMTDIYETGLITLMATIVPGTISGVHDYNYLTSDKFFRESLLSATDPKYKDFLNRHLLNLEADKTITTEEKEGFISLLEGLSSKRDAILSRGAEKSDEAKGIRESIIANYAQIELWNRKKSGDEKLDADLDKKIKKSEENINTLLTKLDKTKDISSSAAENKSDIIATTDNNEEGVGEDALNLPKDELPPPPPNLVHGEDGKLKPFNPIQGDNKTPNTKSFYHGGLSEDFTIDDLDVNRLAEKQQKKGRNYAGFYLYDETQKSGAETYSQQTGKGLHRFDISEDAKILELDNIERVTQKQLNEYRNQGYDLIKGKDVRSRTEYVLLNKEVVKNVVNEKSKVNTNITEDEAEKSKISNPLNIDEKELVGKDTAGKIEVIKNKMKADGILRFEDDVTKQPC